MSDQEVYEAYVMMQPIQAMMMGWVKGYITKMQTFPGRTEIEVTAVDANMQFTLTSAEFATRLRKASHV